MGECNAYGFNIPVQICTGGAVGGGDESNLRIQIANNDASGTQVLQKMDFGSSHTFTGWASGSLDGCNILSSTLTVSTTSNNDELEVSFTVTVDNCPTLSKLYEDCGGSGPHTLTGSQTVPINVGDACPF